MADEKITSLIAGTPKDTDVYLGVDTTDATMAPTGTDKKYSGLNLKSYILNGNAATATTATNFSGSLSGNVTGTQGATVIGNSVVTNAKLANMNASTLKGNNTGGAAAPTDLTVSSVKTMLGLPSTITVADYDVCYGDASGNIAASSGLQFDYNNTRLGVNGFPTSNFQVFGSLAFGIHDTSFAGTYYTTNSDCMIVCDSSTHTIYLNDYANGRMVTIKDGDGSASGSPISVYTNSGSIDGSNPYTINTSYGSVTMVWSDSHGMWYTIANR